jgi:hypothetical protein
VYNTRDNWGLVFCTSPVIVNISEIDPSFGNFMFFRISDHGKLSNPDTLQLMDSARKSIITNISIFPPIFEIFLARTIICNPVYTPTTIASEISIVLSIYGELLQVQWRPWVNKNLQYHRLYRGWMGVWRMNNELERIRQEAVLANSLNFLTGTRKARKSYHDSRCLVRDSNQATH